MLTKVRLVILLLVGVLAAGCTDTPGATRTLEAQGFRDVRVTGYRFFGCGEHDMFRTGFKAVGPTGKPASGVVCSGWLKNYTVRFD